MNTKLIRALLVLVALALMSWPPRPVQAAETMKTCAVTTSSAECVWANANRQWLRVANTGGTNPAFCGTVCPATATNAWSLTANQGTVIDTGSGEGLGGGPERAKPRYCCISTGGATTVVWQDVTAGGPSQSPSPTPAPTPTP